MAGLLIITFHPPHLTNTIIRNGISFNGMEFSQQSKNSIYHQLCCRVILLDFLVRALLLFTNFPEKKIKYFEGAIVQQQEDQLQ